MLPAEVIPEQVATYISLFKFPLIFSQLQDGYLEKTNFTCAVILLVVAVTWVKESIAP
jgi:hypothetical protein